MNSAQLYASVAKGYKAGGNNLLSTDPGFKPEKNVVEELGSKTMFADNNLRFNSAVFLSQYDSIQVQIVILRICR
jgi:iron complex outermembrane receptor protein